MAVKVKIKRPKTPKLTAQHFRHPGEQPALRQALLTAGGLGLGVLVLLALTPFRIQLVVAFLAWLALCFLLYPASTQAKQRAALAKRDLGGPARDELAQHLAQQAATLNTAAPRLLLDPDARQCYLLGNAIVAPAGIRAHLTDPEVWAALTIELGHLHAGHARLLGFVRLAGREGSPILRRALFPLRVFVMLLARWHDYAQMTADRLALLLIRDRGVVGGAVLKQEVWAAESSDVSAADVADYLARAGGVKAEGAEVTAHYRIGEFLRARPWLTERLREISIYGGSNEYREAQALV